MNRPKLIHLNGAAGVGKDTIAQRFVDNHPLALCIRSDELITQLGQWQRQYDPARRLAFDLLLAMAATHLTSGRDVIVPHLLTDLGEAEALETVARDHSAVFVEILLDTSKEDALERVFARGTRGEPGAPPLTEADRPEFEELYDNVRLAVKKRPNCVAITSVNGDIDETYRKVVQIIEM